MGSSASSAQRWQYSSGAVVSAQPAWPLIQRRAEVQGRLLPRCARTRHRELAHVSFQWQTLGDKMVRLVDSHPLTLLPAGSNLQSIEPVAHGAAHLDYLAVLKLDDGEWYPRSICRPRLRHATFHTDCADALARWAPQTLHVKGDGSTQAAIRASKQRRQTCSRQRRSERGRRCASTERVHT